MDGKHRPAGNGEKASTRRAGGTHNEKLHIPAAEVVHPHPAWVTRLTDRCNERARREVNKLGRHLDVEQPSSSPGIYSSCLGRRIMRGL